MLCGVIHRLSTGTNGPVPHVCVTPAVDPGTFTAKHGRHRTTIYYARNVLRVLGRHRVHNMLKRRLVRICGRSVLASTVTSTVTAIVSCLNCSLVCFNNNGSHSSHGNSSSGNLKLLNILLDAVLTPVTTSLVRVTVSHAQRCSTSRSNSVLARSPRTLTSTLGGVSGNTRTVPVRGATNARSITTVVVTGPFSTRNFSHLFSARPTASSHVTQLVRVDRRVGTQNMRSNCLTNNCTADKCTSTSVHQRSKSISNTNFNSKKCSNKNCSQSCSRGPMRNKCNH